MSTYLAVHHPGDTALPAYDFYGWRVLRRLVADRLIAAAPGAGALTPQVRAAAAALERERLLPIHLPPLESLVGVPAMADLGALLTALGARLVRDPGARRQFSWTVTVLDPSWDRIPAGRPVFIGSADGVPVEARLVPTLERDPEYVLLVRRGAREETLVQLPTPAMPDAAVPPLPVDMAWAPAVWDWLFARRLTLLCASGCGTWPAPGTAPVVLPGIWSAPELGL